MAIQIPPVFLEVLENLETLKKLGTDEGK